MRMAKTPLFLIPNPRAHTHQTGQNSRRKLAKHNKKLAKHNKKLAEMSQKHAKNSKKLSKSNTHSQILAEKSQKLSNFT